MSSTAKADYYVYRCVDGNTDEHSDWDLDAAVECAKWNYRSLVDCGSEDCRVYVIDRTTGEFVARFG